MSVHDPKRIGPFQHLQPPQTSSGLVLEKAGGGSETDVCQDAGEGLQRWYCRMTEGRDITGHASTAVRGTFPHPEGGGTVSGVLADARVALQAGVTLIGVDDN